MNDLDIDSYIINGEIESFLDRCSTDDDKGILEAKLYEQLEKDNSAFYVYGEYPLILLNKE